MVLTGQAERSAVYRARARGGERISFVDRRRPERREGSAGRGLTWEGGRVGERAGDVAAGRDDRGQEREGEREQAGRREQHGTDPVWGGREGKEVREDGSALARWASDAAVVAVEQGAATVECEPADKA